MPLIPLVLMILLQPFLGCGEIRVYATRRAPRARLDSLGEDGTSFLQRLCHMTTMFMRPPPSLLAFPSLAAM